MIGQPLKTILKTPVALSLPVFLFFGATAFAQEIDPRYTLCKLQKEVRILRVEKAEGGKCKTTYTKYGKDQTVGEAQNPSSCGEVLGKVKGTLETAGWKCREVKDASVSYLNEETQ